MSPTHASIDSQPQPTNTQPIIMNPPCSNSECDVYDTNNIPYENNHENKTDNEASMVAKVENGQNHRQQIDDLEREDFDEENRIIKQCSRMIVDPKVASTGNFSGMSANSSLASSSETISNFASIPLFSHDFSIPSCSKKDECDDSNTTIKNMIRKKTVFGIDIAPRNLENCEQANKKEDFMQKLLNRNTEKIKDIPKGKMYKAELMEPCETETCELDVLNSGPSGRTSSNASSIGSSGSDCTKDFTVPSTSNAEKLLGLGDHKKSEPGCSKSKYIKSYDEDSEEEEGIVDETSWCTCMSSHEDDDEQDDDAEPEDRLWQRKRRYEPQPSMPAKKFCPDSAMTSNAGAEGSWSNNSVQGPPDLKHWLNKFESWGNVEKIQAIDALINQCEARDVRHMMKVIEPLFQRDFISLLPKELALTVLGYLDAKDLLRAAQTCRYWKFLADDNLLWKEQCRKIGIMVLRKQPSSLPRSTGPWKAAYARQYLIENNWLNKPVDNPIVMRGHDEHVITCLQFYGTRILSGSDDTTLKVWSAITGKCLRTLVGHSGGVWSSQMVGDLVISGSTDRTLRVWDAKSGYCLKVLAGHTSTVRCMHLFQNKVVSGSRDATLRLWSIPEGRCLRVLVGHLAAVRCVQYNGKLVVSGAYDYFVKVWNPHTGECLHTLAGHTNRVYSLQFDGIHVVSGSLDTSIRVWDVESGQLKHTLTGHQSLTSGMELNQNILVSGNADSTVKVWNIATGHCLHTLSGPNKHQSAVTCLQSSNRFVITSSDDGTVKLWDVRTGEFIRNLVELGSGGQGGVVWRIKASATKLICAVGSRNGTEETKLMVLDFDVPGVCRKCEE